MGWGTLLFLLAVLAFAGLLVARHFEGAMEPGPRGPTVGPIVDPIVVDAQAGAAEPAPTQETAASVAARTRAATRPADPRGLDAVYDPQRAAMRSTFATPTDGGLGTLPFTPLVRAARLRTIRGEARLAPGAACEVRVLPADHPPHDCAIRVLCAGVVLYPDASQSRGYLTCDLREGTPVGARDDAPSAADGDPMLELSLGARTARVEEEGPRAYEAVLELLSY